MKNIKELSKENLNGKRILLRTDLDVPIIGGQIQDVFRIKKQKETLDYLLNEGARIAMVAHINAADSFKDLIPEIKKILGREIIFAEKIEELSKVENHNRLILLDNIRKWPGEKKDDPDLASALALNFDYYVNNGFAESHRKYTSISAITELLPSYAGLLLEKEVAELSKIIQSPKKGKLVIIGGAKAETKVPVIKNLLDKSERIILGGVVANDVLKERGVDIADSTADRNSEELLVGLDIYDKRLILAEDFNIKDGKVLDIGPKSIDKFISLIRLAGMVIWNGPVGLFEDPDYAKGTNAIATTLAGLKSFKIIGGGDTISAVNKLGLLDKFDFVSTGGGAMLAFLAGEKLPGLEALHYYE